MSSAGSVALHTGIASASLELLYDLLLRGPQKRIIEAMDAVLTLHLGHSLPYSKLSAQPVAILNCITLYEICCVLTECS